MRLDELESEVADVGAMQHQASVLTLLSIREVLSINTAQHQQCAQHQSNTQQQSSAESCSIRHQYLLGGTHWSSHWAITQRTIGGGGASHGKRSTWISYAQFPPHPYLRFSQKVVCKGGCGDGAWGLPPLQTNSIKQYWTALMCNADFSEEKSKEVTIAV